MATEPQTTPEIDDDEEGGKRRQDPELLALGRILRIVGELPKEAQGRVAQYLLSRFGNLPF